MAFSLEQLKEAELASLCRQYAVQRLKLFGSATRDDFDPMRSDLDFLVEFGAPPEGMRLGTQFFGFLEGLESLFETKVDLLEESAIENSRLRTGALASAVTLYAA
jgi:hypothetical protein